MSTAPIINQKEYLKRYLNIGNDENKKKKKKKKLKTAQSRVKIIDDNIDIINSETIAPNELDEFLTQEDAPQVVGVIDDRPLELRLDDYRKNSKWKLVGSDDEESKRNQVQSSKRGSERDLSPKRSKYESGKTLFQKNRRRHSDSDESPPRRGQSPKDSSPPRKHRNRSSDSDASPPRRTQHKNSDSDISPPRKNRHSPDLSPKHNRKNYDSDPSPPRKIKRQPQSPERRKRSPQNRHRSPDLNPKHNRKNYDSDCSPPRNRMSESPKRRKRADSDDSPPRRIKTERRSPSFDNRQQIKRYDSDTSPPRRKRRESLQSPKQKQLSPPRKRSNFEDKHKKKSRWDPSPDRSPPRSKSSSKLDLNKLRTSKKMDKTLDGKKAGLQNAKELMKEIEAYKQRENDLFNKMAAQSSDSSAPVIRDRKTGRKRDFEKEAMEEFEKIRKEQAQKEKYDRWGKGLKQVENIKEKIESEIHEMNKPLARYADDEDLERHLKEQERDGDPMLAYIRKKKRQQAVDEGKPMRPMYQGEFMPNRFNIPPGHRWDGVDRSCGFEKKWFDKQNSKKAMEEDIYKWSTEDM